MPFSQTGCDRRAVPGRVWCYVLPYIIPTVQVMRGMLFIIKKHECSSARSKNDEKSWMGKKNQSNYSHFASHFHMRVKSGRHVEHAFKCPQHVSGFAASLSERVIHPSGADDHTSGPTRFWCTGRKTCLFGKIKDKAAGVTCRAKQGTGPCREGRGRRRGLQRGGGSSLYCADWLYGQLEEE